MVDLLPCDLAAVLRLRRGDWHLIAASNQDAIDGRAAQSRALSDLAEKLPVTTDGGVWPDPAKLSQEGIEQLLSSAHFGGIAWCHVRSSGSAEPNIVLLGLWHEPLAGPGPARETLAWCGVRLAKAMDAATLFQNIPLRPLLAAFGRMSRAWRENRRGRVLGLVVAPVLVALAVLLYPAPFKIKADCVVLPSQLVAVVAEADGRVSKVIAREGDQVAAGQVLAQQEDLEFVTQLEVSRQQLARWQVEAARAQALGQEAERKLAELSVRREEANIRRLEYLRGRTELRSPINGLVLTKGISRREGEALQKGEVFCEVGSAEAFELQLDVRQQDAGAVLDALQSGAPLSVDFLLHSHARHPLRGELSGSDSLSQLPELRANQSVFTARLPIPAQVLKEKGIDLRSGYTGKASIRLGRRPLGWLLVRPFRQFWSVNWSL
jgi:multidrug efflux pump subunit AcrA (membrane-fusion protein)